MPTHEKRGASSAEAWFLCPGMIRLCEGLEDAPGEAAQKGTVVHLMNELCWERNTWPESMLDSRITADPGTRYAREFTANGAMVSGSRVFLEWLRGLAPSDKVEAGMVTVQVEQKCTLDWLYPETGGTCDARIYDWENRTLHIGDYKNGVGEVDPEWNKQLLIYALGAMHGIPDGFIHNVTLWVIQPNIPGPAVKHWSLAPWQLQAWGREVLRPACERTEDPDAPLFASPKSCRWCKAKKAGTCPAIKRYATEIAKTEFLNPTLPTNFAEMTPDMLEKIADSVELFKSWAEQAKGYMLQQAEAGVMQFPSYKLVRGRANRKWKPEAEQQLAGILGDAAYKRSLIGIGAAENQLKARNMDARAITNNLTEKPLGSLTLAPRTDRREEVIPAAQFTVIE